MRRIDRLEINDHGSKCVHLQSYKHVNATQAYEDDVVPTKKNEKYIMSNGREVSGFFAIA